MRAEREKNRRFDKRRLRAASHRSAGCLDLRRGSGGRDRRNVAFHHKCDIPLAALWAVGLLPVCWAWVLAPGAVAGAARLDLPAAAVAHIGRGAVPVASLDIQVAQERKVGPWAAWGGFLAALWGRPGDGVGVREEGGLGLCAGGRCSDSPDAKLPEGWQLGPRGVVWRCRSWLRWGLPWAHSSRGRRGSRRGPSWAAQWRRVLGAAGQCRAGRIERFRAASGPPGGCWQLVSENTLQVVNLGGIK